MTTVEKLMTADEFAALPGPIEGGKMELVAGRVITMAPVGEEHGNHAITLITRLHAYLAAHPQGVLSTEVGFRLRHNPDLVRAPDVSFTAHDALDPNRDRRKYIDGPPTLAVEVMSPDDRDEDISRKTGEYLDAGALRVWVVRPALRTVTVHRPGGDAHTYNAGDTLTSDDAGFTTPGFELPLATLFA